MRRYRQGLLACPARRVYSLAEARVTEHHSLAAAAKFVPRCVVCLLPVLRFQGLTTQDPYEVWMAIDFKAHKPSVLSPALRVVRFSGSDLVDGVEA
ncbi:type IV toxin-antitoxin system AbiEi family antitoxin domain-containing protein [Paludibaculum fermentans]|uniref:type IV toxin-antitoxin system AbiEi family antitoxin domain-containing protein n=1 Tax=Paludibaculum fermentans TaxID=1473598 RepID=UPI001E57C965|nr:hypothetical protein [Paludibaculum fermentans]